jgi:hypothetical protein
MWLAEPFIIRILNHNFTPNAKKKAMAVLKGLKLILISLGHWILLFGSILLVPWGLGRLLEWISGWKIPPMPHDNPINNAPVFDRLASVWFVGLAIAFLGLAIYLMYRYCLYRGGWEEKNDKEDEWDQAHKKMVAMVRRETELQQSRQRQSR